MKIHTTPSLDVQVMMQYVDYHNHIDLDIHKDLSEEELAKKLQDKTEDHQKWTFVLAHREKPLAFHAIDDFQQTLEPGFLHDRCEMAKQEAGMWIEQDLLDGKSDGMMIMGGAGGVGSMMRYYITLLPTGSEPQSIIDAISGIKKEEFFNIESGEIVSDAIVVTVLIDIHYSVDEIVMQWIEDLQKDGYTLLTGYGALNTEYPSEEFIHITREHIQAMEEKKKQLLKNGKKMTPEESFQQSEWLVDICYDLKEEYRDLAMRCHEQGIEFVLEDDMLEEKKSRNEGFVRDSDLPF